MASGFCTAQIASISPPHFSQVLTSSLKQFLNLDAVRDFSEKFDGFLIDLTDIGYGSKEKLDKKLLIEEFEKFLSDDQRPKAILDGLVTHSTNAQYKQGL